MIKYEKDKDAGHTGILSYITINGRRFCYTCFEETKDFSYFCTLCYTRLCDNCREYSDVRERRCARCREGQL